MKTKLQIDLPKLRKGQKCWGCKKEIKGEFCWNGHFWHERCIEKDAIKRFNEYGGRVS